MQNNDVPLSENEHVKELLGILEKNDALGKQELLEVFGNVGAMEQQLKNAAAELAAIRQELQAMRQENRPLKAVAQDTVAAMQKQVVTLRERFGQLKQHVIDGCKNAADAFCQKGITALDNVAKFFKVQPALEAIHDQLTAYIKIDERAIAKIESVSAEYHKAGMHLKNIGRALAGKQLVEQAKGPGKLAQSVSAPYRAERACLLAMRQSAHKAIDSLARLEKEAQRKPSLLKNLQELKAQPAQPPKGKTAPEVARNER